MDAKRILLTYLGYKDKRVAYSVIWGGLITVIAVIAFSVIVDSNWWAVLALLFIVPACLGLTDEVRKRNEYTSHLYLLAAVVIFGYLIAFSISDSFRDAFYFLPLLVGKYLFWL